MRRTFDWSAEYNSGRDYRLATSLEISRYLAGFDEVIGLRSIDIGCGTGQLSRELVHRGFKVTGVDSSAAAIRIARELTVLGDEYCNYIQLDMFRNNAEWVRLGEFDLVISRLVIAFVDPLRRFFEIAGCLVAPGGRLVIVTPNVAWLPDERKQIGVALEELLVASRRDFEVDEQWRSGELAHIVFRRTIRGGSSEPG